MRVVERQVLNGADWIKVMATGGMRTPGTRVEALKSPQRQLENDRRWKNHLQYIGK